MDRQYDALALFSGGLDSILACRVIQDQGLKVLGLHFVTPFFGYPEKIPHWEEVYGVEIMAVDISEKYIQMMLDVPEHGMGKLVNPCVDCKIMMISHAKTLLKEFGAKFIISGEVTGQRPMSQRAPVLNAIRNSSGTADVLLRPLCAQSQPVTPMEESGLVDRSKLPDIFGRGRKIQLDMAAAYGFSEIPTPAGGCKLTEYENAARFFPLLRRLEKADVNSFRLATTGRQFWSGDKLLSIGRDQKDNDRIEDLYEAEDYLFEVRGFPGPLSLGRSFCGAEWDRENIREAAALTASFSPKAVRSGEEIPVAVITPSGEMVVKVMPERETGFVQPGLDGLKEWKIARAEDKQG
ncbi:tRNA(5-methylaminomethyl-2-thiouridylate) methyltransferase [Maridesulfovibrio sp. FT414]|uniref:tRNA(5-methylaminomethyl-2-thiouridylate) methyltransferase n=1 Tax=Maridesulfovibrio sp. FT414 TaxID=2979469 RepID=UPI003D808183